jgi:hypothetical protein
MNLAKMQFQRLPPEVKRAALWRLAWTGLTIEQIAQRTGWSVEQVRRAIDEEAIPPGVSSPPEARWAAARQALRA